MKKYIVDIIVALGGNIAVIIILLRLVKTRVEKYLDTIIETKASEQLAKFESDLEKRKLYFEASIAAEQELYKRLIAFYVKTTPIIEQDLSTFQELIDKNLVFSSAQSLFNNNAELKVILEEENGFVVENKIYLDSSVSNAHQQILKKLNKYLSEIDNNRDTYDLPPSEKRRILNNLKEIKTGIESVLSGIRRTIEKKTN